MAACQYRWPDDRHLTAVTLTDDKTFLVAVLSNLFVSKYCCVCPFVYHLCTDNSLANLMKLVTCYKLDSL